MKRLLGWVAAVVVFAFALLAAKPRRRVDVASKMAPVENEIDAKKDAKQGELGDALKNGKKGETYGIAY